MPRPVTNSADAILPPRRSWYAWLGRLGVAALAASAVALAAASLRWPLSWDEGVFAWVAGAIRAGGMPYVDAWDLKGPVTYYGYALAQLLFGPAAWGLRLFDLLVTCGGCAAVYRLLSRPIGWRPAALASLLLFLTVLGQGYNVAGQPDVWAAWCLVAAVTLLVDSPSDASLALSAACIGVATLIKPLYGALLLLPAIPAIALAPGRWRLQLRHLVAIGLGFAFPILVSVAWFWHRGALGAFIEAYLRFNLTMRVGTRASQVNALTATLEFLRERPALVLALPAALAGLADGGPVPKWRRLLLFTWIVLAASLVLLQGRWSPYHWAPLYPPMCIAAAIGLHRAWTANASALPGAPFRLAAASLGLIGAFTLLGAVHYIRHWVVFVVHRTSVEQYESDFGQYPGGGTATDVRRAAELVRTQTRPADRVLVWTDPTVNVLSGRPSVGRFICWPPLVSWSPHASPPPILVRYRSEFFRSLAEQPPVLVLMDRAAWRGGDSTAVYFLPVRFPELLEWIDARYVLIDTVGKFLVFRPH